MFAAVFFGAPLVAADPALLQTVAAHVRELDQVMGQRATHWMVDPGAKACLLRDGDDRENSRILFIRETGTISMWITPRVADVAAKVASNQLYQLYFVPLGDDPPNATASEFPAALWQEPLAKTGMPGLAVAVDPFKLLEKYPGGFGVVLGQGDHILFADLVRPEIATMLADLKSCRGGR